MSKHCNYQFVAGDKKGKLCGKFIRAKGAELCCQHKPKKVETIPPKEPIIESNRTRTN